VIEGVSSAAVVVAIGMVPFVVEGVTETEAGNDVAVLSFAV
jgi:hypothetical protein